MRSPASPRARRAPPPPGPGQPRRGGADPGGRDPGPRARPGDGARARGRLPRDPRETVRRRPCSALGEIDAPGAGDVLRTALRDESSLVRQQAVLVPRQAAGSGADRRLSCRCSTIPIRRMRFVTAAGPRPDPQARKRCRGCSPSSPTPRKELRFAAVEALGAIRAVAAVRPLVEALARPGPQPAPRGRGEPGRDRRSPGRARRSLLALEDEHWSVRCAAATALGRHPEAPRPPRPCWDACADDDATVRRAAVAALGEMRRRAGRRARSSRPCATPGLQATALEALRRLGAAALPEMERAFAAPDADRSAAAAGGPRRATRGPARAPAAARRPRRRQRPRTRGGGPRPGRRRLPGSGASAHGPQGLRPFARRAPGRGPRPQEAVPAVMPPARSDAPSLATTTPSSPRRSSGCSATSSTSSFGLYFDDTQRGSLRSRLAGRLSQPRTSLSFEDYYHYLRFAPAARRGAASAW